MFVSIVGMFVGMARMFANIVGVRVGVVEMYMGIVGMFVLKVPVSIVEMLVGMARMFVGIVGMVVVVVRMFTAFRMRVAKVFRAFAFAVVERDMHAGSKYAKPALARYLKPPASDPQCFQPPFKLRRVGPGVHKRAEIHIPAYARKTVVI